MFSDICTVSDEAFGRLTIERCWDSWLSECQNSNKELKTKKQSDYTLNKTNRRFGGWSSEGMKRYDEIAKLVKSDRELNQQAELFFKHLMMEKLWRQSKYPTDISSSSIVRYSSKSR